MKINLFKGCKNLEDVKKLYKTKCKEWHPDINPDIDTKLIQELNAQYNYITKNKISYPIIDIQSNIQTLVNDSNKNYKDTVAYKYKQQIKKTKEELDELIKKNYSVVIKNNYKPISLYFKFLDYIKENNIKAEKSHFELIGKLLDYKSGWAYHKYEEYTQELNKTIK